MVIMRITFDYLSNRYAANIAVLISLLQPFVK